MKLFLAYRHTGADPAQLEKQLPAVRDALLGKVDEVYCTFFEENDFQDKSMSAADIMHHAFDKITELGGLFVLLSSEGKSEGMLMEVGYCIAKNIPVIVAKHDAVQHTYVPSLANITFDYADDADLVEQINKLDLAGL